MKNSVIDNYRLSIYQFELSKRPPMSNVLLILETMCRKKLKKHHYVVFTEAIVPCKSNFELTQHTLALFYLCGTKSNLGQQKDWNDKTWRVCKVVCRHRYKLHAKDRKARHRKHGKMAATKNKMKYTHNANVFFSAKTVDWLGILCNRLQLFCNTCTKFATPAAYLHHSSIECICKIAVLRIS